LGIHTISACSSAVQTLSPPEKSSSGVHTFSACSSAVQTLSSLGDEPSVCAYIFGIGITCNPIPATKVIKKKIDKIILEFLASLEFLFLLMQCRSDDDGEQNGRAEFLVKLFLAWIQTRNLLFMVIRT